MSNFDAARLMDKLPPSAPEAEVACLGSIILNGRACGEVLQILRSPEDFYRSSHATIYSALLELHNDPDPIDIVRLTQKLADKGVLDDVGGVDYLIKLSESVPHPEGAGAYARMIRDKAVTRDLIDAASKTLYRCHNEDASSTDLLSKASSELLHLQQDRSDRRSIDLTKLLDQTLEQLVENDGKEARGMPSGFIDLDEMTGGMHDGEVTIVAARPSMGKTAFMLNIAEHVAIEKRKPVAVFSMEMSSEQLAYRMLSSRSGVDSRAMRLNKLARHDFGMLQETFGRVSGSPMYIDDTPGLTPAILRAKAHQLKLEHDVSAVFIDYLQLMHEPGYKSRQEEVSSISRQVKALARDLNVPVICLSQLNRLSEQRENHRPKMSDLRESGSIEQDADVVMMVHREDYYHRNDPAYEPDHTAEIILVKQRNGPVGTTRLQFHGPTTRFNNLARDF